MFYHVIFFDTIILYWDKPSLQGEYKFRVEVDGGHCCFPSSTHCTICGLAPKTQYRVTVCAVQEDKSTLLYDANLTTSPLPHFIDVTQPPYCAANDGVTLCTEAIQRALDDCTANDVVYFPQGTYLCGALDVHSNGSLLLDGATICGSSSVNDYLPMIDSRFEGYEMPCFRSLINVGKMNHNNGCTTDNVIIRGNGSIIGGGEKLYYDTLNYEKQLWGENANTVWGRTRGRLINVSNAKDVFIDGLTLGYAPAWNVHMIYCDNVVTSNCKFKSFGIHNGDGWDPDSSVNCTIFGCDFDVGDDCIAVKSGKNPQGNVIARPCKNIKVFDCIAHRGHGCSLGSELSGGIQDVFVWDCDFEHTLYGLHLKTTAKRGGYVNNVQVDNCIFSNVNIHTVGYNDDGESANELTTMSDIALRKVKIASIRYLDEQRNESCEALVVDNKDFILQNVLLQDVTVCDSTKTDLQAVTSCNSVTVNNLICLDKLL